MHIYRSYTLDSGDLNAVYIIFTAGEIDYVSSRPGAPLPGPLKTSPRPEFWVNSFRFDSQGIYLTLGIFFAYILPRIAVVLAKNSPSGGVRGCL